MKKNNLNNSQVTALIITVLVFDVGLVLAIIIGFVLGNLRPNLNVNQPFLIKAYQSVFGQELSNKTEKKVIKNSILFNKDQTAISPEGKESLKDIITTIETKQILTIRIASYSEKSGDTPLKLGNLVKQYLEENLTKQYRLVLIGYPLTEAEKLDARIEFWLD